MTARPALRVVADQRLAGLVTRVSTDRQARNDEGSLKTQLQRLRQHIEYKTGVGGEDWSEAAVYELRAISGKDSMRSAEFERLFADIRAGRINTVLCTSLDRICRSVRDFLHFFEVLSSYNVEFVCLKQNYDTTSPQGKLFVTIMMALAEFEREQTAERTRDAVAARSERGLWNGGRLLGYDLDADHKGNLIPNEAESVLVNFAFDTYLECGSIAETAIALNGAGFRSKSYVSRRQLEHPGGEFGTTTVQHMLKNRAYLGQKVISDTDGSSRSVPAVWLAIVDAEKFARVETLMAANGRSNHSGTATVRHAHLLGRGLLICGRCRGVMQGRSGTGRGGVTYFYYACINKDCALRVVADEVESAVIDRLGFLAADEQLVSDMVAVTNRQTESRLNALDKRLKAHQRDLKSLRAKAATILARDADGDADVRSLVNEELGDLARQRTQLENSTREVEDERARLLEASVIAESVTAALANFTHLYRHLNPHEQREVIALLVGSVELQDGRMTVEIYERACLRFGQAHISDSRFEATSWLPGTVAQSVLRHTWQIQLPSVRTRKRTDARSRRRAPVVEKWAEMLACGEAGSRAELARLAGVSRARVTQALRGLETA